MRFIADHQLPKLLSYQVAGHDPGRTELLLPVAQRCMGRSSLLSFTGPLAICPLEPVMKINEHIIIQWIDEWLFDGMFIKLWLCLSLKMKKANNNG